MAGKKAGANGAKAVRGKPFQKGADARRTKTGAAANPNGRPKDQASITYWLKQFAGMSPVQVAEHCEVYAKELRKHPGELPIAGVIAARMLMQQMDEPQPGVLGQVLDRTDGPVENHVTVAGDAAAPLTIRVIREGGYAEPAEPAPGTAADQAGGAAL